ncbi:uncharacterized protein LOC109709525 [Ananas comosus]|uniref:Uncharacterized protein LOC109709525 n=2 Tax=Ananas comosus TaxID=4615 RepID=A0A6P5F214_ANACO|nr:uncharacterized protein LOC109709525 [Ananas comosus]
MFLHSLLMQEPKNPQTRKSWYRRAMEVILILWKPQTKSPIRSSTNGIAPNCEKPKLRKCTSLKVASSFTRVCLCAPISSYNEVFHADVPPRRSYSYPRSKSFVAPTERSVLSTSTRSSVENRRIFRGKSLRDDILMRRFVVEEEAMMQLRIRRNQIEFIRKRNVMRRKKLGPSPLSKMVLSEEGEEDDDDEEEKEKEKEEKK